MSFRQFGAFCPRSNLIMREVENIDLKGQIVTVSPGFRPRQLQLNYDHLVIALGNITNFHGMPGLIENAMPFRTLADAMVLRNHVIHVLEEADVEEDPELRRRLLTFVVGGGGFSGVDDPLPLDRHQPFYATCLRSTAQIAATLTPASRAA